MLNRITFAGHPIALDKYERAIEHSLGLQVLIATPLNRYTATVVKLFGSKTYVQL